MDGGGMDGDTPVSEARTESGDVRELRLAIVCYGGVSLAVYMHGVTKEIQKLVTASAAFELDESHNPFAEDDTARTYWDLLARLRFGDTPRADHQPIAPRVRVVVDIVSGTSAGGINGICLAKAIATNRPQDSLRGLWLDEGDIKRLLRGPSWVPASARFAAFVLRSLARPLKVTPPLRGDRMCTLLYEAFAGMDRSDPVLPGVDTLVPSGQTLDLFVPVTDFHGYDREIPLDDPRFVRDRTHRHVLWFHHDPASSSRFDRQFNHGLAFAARATSSFPGAFPPISFASYAAAFDKGRRRPSTPPDDAPNLPAVLDDLFPLYALSPPAAAERSYFVDGGVLDNFPFRSTIEAIATKQAWTEVDRRLVFIEPDPAGGAGMSAGEAPTWHGAIWGSIAAIPRKEPVLDDFLWVAKRNQAVARVRDIIETSFPEVSAEVGRLVRGEVGELPPETPTGEELAAWHLRVTERAAERAGFAHGSYLRLRVRDVVDRYASAVCALLNFPDTSYHAAFVANVLRSWAKRDGLLSQSATATESQREFLAAHDLAYHERRIRFVIAALNWWYRDVGTTGFLTRTQLDTGKWLLYRRIEDLEAIARDAATDPALVDPLHRLFDRATLRQTVLERQEDTADFVDRNVDVLVAVRDALRARVAAALPSIEEAVHGDLKTLMSQCSPQVAGALLTRYVGFPYWDVLTYPMEALSGVRERDHVEAVRLSPVDVSLLSTQGEEKLQGVSLAHFGAFFSRKGRENDYLWGRLDAGERLITLLLDDPRQPGLTPPDIPACRSAFEAILADESELKNVRDLMDTLRGRVAALSPSIVA
jgi:patatin-related protein